MRRTGVHRMDEESPRGLRGQLIRLLRRLVGEEESLRYEMATGAGGTFLLKALAKTVGFLTSVLLARVLGSEGYGAYVYALAWASLMAMVGRMGLSKLLTREVSTYYTEENWPALSGILRWSLGVVLSVSLGLVVLAGLGNWFLGGMLAEQIRRTLWWALPIIPLFALLHLWKGGLHGLGRVVEGVVPVFAVLPITFITLLGGAHWLVGLTAPLAVALRMSAIAVAVAIATLMLRRYLPAEVAASGRESEGRRWFQSAFPMFLVSVFGQTGNRVPELMLGSMVGPEAVGIYSIAKRGTELVTFIRGPVVMPLAPAVARLHSQKETECLQRLVTKAARIVLFTSLPVAAGLVVARDWFLGLFGQEFTAGGVVLILLVVGSLVNNGMGSVGWLLNMTGYERDAARGIGIGAAVNLVLCAVLIPILGTEGAALSTMLAITTWNALMSFWLYRRTGIQSAAVGPVR